MLCYITRLKGFDRAEKRDEDKKDNTALRQCKNIKISAMNSIPFFPIQTFFNSTPPYVRKGSRFRVIKRCHVFAKRSNKD